VRDEKAWRCHFASRQAQATRGHQVDLIENADDDSEARPFEAFFNRIQSFASVCRFDYEKAPGVETKMSETRKRWRAEFSGECFRPTPECPRLLLTIC
jgi:hypothetical protein